MRPSSLEVARRLERGEASCVAARIDALRAADPRSAAARLHVAGGQAGFVAPRSPLNDARGLGMKGPVGEHEVLALEAFFRARGEAATLRLCPFADPSLTAALGTRCYRLTAFEQVLVKARDGAAWARDRREVDRVAAEHVEVERVPATGAVEWARLVAEGFDGEGRATPEAIAVGLCLFHSPDTVCFRALLAGRPAGGAAMVVEGGIAFLFGASTRAEARGRGVQSALLEARLAHAARAGCDLATVSTVPGTASQRNVERHGFVSAFTRAILVET